jgi:small subunit ribosomal protein S4
MSINAQCKICRRAGKKLFLKGERCQTSACALVKRSYAPGLHGQKTAGSRLTDYGRQLREKQSAKNTYNLREKPFLNYFKKAVKKGEETGPAVFRMLEMRLDNVILRLGFAKSVKQARQIVSHEHVKVNDRKVNISSYQVKVNDIISLKERSVKESKLFADLDERLKNYTCPDWLYYDEKTKSGKVVDLPDIKKAALTFDMRAIIEFYSR